jgi:hypothetical protein
MRPRLLEVYSDVIKIVALNDLHLSPFNPASFKPTVSFYEHTLETIQQVFRFALKQQVQAITVAGDVFHLKSPLRNPLWFINEVIDLLKSTGIPVLGIAGNHDLRFGSLDGLKGQPLETLIKAEAFYLLDGQPWVIKGTKAPGIELKISGASFHHGSAEGLLSPAIVRDDADQLMLGLGHFNFGPANGSFFGESVYGPEYFAGTPLDIIQIGHHHRDQDTPRVDGRLYLTMGSINRTGMHPDDLVRRPAAGYLEVKRDPVTGVAQYDAQILRPAVKAMTDLVDVEQREILLKEQIDLQNFTASLAQVQATEQDPLAIAEKMELTDTVREKIKYYLGSAEK